MNSDINLDLNSFSATSPLDELQSLNTLGLSLWISHLSKPDFESRLPDLHQLDFFVAALMELPEAQLSVLLELFKKNDWLQLKENSEIDDYIFFLECLSEEEREEVIASLPHSPKVKQVLNYPEGSCGREMQTDFFTIPIDQTAGEGLNWIRKKASSTDLIYYLYFLSQNDKLEAVASLRELALAEPDSPIKDILEPKVESVYPRDPVEKAIEIVKREDYVALPVVSREGRMLGLITVDDVLDLVEEQATADIYATAGLQQMDSVAMSGWLSYVNRAPWLLLNLALACLASLMISFFEATISEIILLASLMHIAAALGGNTAIQTLTVVTRGLATGDFKYVSFKKALIKEILVGMALGVTTGFVACLIVYIWKNDFLMGALLGASMAINSLVASSAGAFIPLLLKKYGKDPAIASGVLVTTITDIFSFFSFLGIVSLLYLY